MNSGKLSCNTAEREVLSFWVGGFRRIQTQTVALSSARVSKMFQFCVARINTNTSPPRPLTLSLPRSTTRLKH